MTAFTRSNSGLSNQHLFHGSDLIVFTEGGRKALSYDAVLQGEANYISPDIKFWDGLLKACNFNVDYSIRAIGSKSTLKILCEKIAAGEIRNIVVAMDRDMDYSDEDIYLSPYILYTKGYSWENDAFKKSLTLKQIETMVLSVALPPEARSEIEQAYNKFKRFGRHILKFEFGFRSQGIRFISDVRGDRFYNSKKSPNIRIEQVYDILKEKKEMVGKGVKFSRLERDICPMEGVYGKLIMAQSLSAISYICRKYSSINSVPTDMIVAAMIDRFLNYMRNNPDQYYSAAVSGLLSELD